MWNLSSIKFVMSVVLDHLPYWTWSAVLYPPAPNVPRGCPKFLTSWPILSLGAFSFEKSSEYWVYHVWSLREKLLFLNKTLYLTLMLWGSPGLWFNVKLTWLHRGETNTRMLGFYVRELVEFSSGNLGRVFGHITATPGICYESRSTLFNSVYWVDISAIFGILFVTLLAISRSRDLSRSHALALYLLQVFVNAAFMKLKELNDIGVQHSRGRGSGVTYREPQYITRH